VDEVENENEKVVVDAYDAFLRGDLAWLFACLTDDVEWIEPGPPERIPTAGVRRGREGVAEFVRRAHETFELQAFEPRTIVSIGNEVVVVGTFRRRAHSTGKVEAGDWVHLFRLRNGRIRRYQAFTDTAATLSVLE
jgi:ketosteroid isomerase-like protein